MDTKTTDTKTAAPASVALVTTPPRQSISFGDADVQLTTLEDAYRFAKYVVESGFAPKGLDKPESVLIAMQHGYELGLKPMAALQNIALINGRPGIYGDAALALVRASGLCAHYSQTVEGVGDERKAVVKVQRKGESEIVSTFSVGNAKTANLWGKQGPWSQYPERMLMFRARGFALRDAFGDVLKGLATVEEIRDIPAEVNVTPRGGLEAAVDGVATQATEAAS